MLAVLSAVGMAACGAEPAREPTTYSFVIPSGTSSRIKIGEKVDVMPAKVVLHVGDTLYIRNEDRMGLDVGAYYIRGNDEMKLTYGAAGTFVGSCALSGSGTFTVQVLE